MKTRIVFSLLLACALAPLVACSNAKEKLGFTRTAPDEFAVLRRAPLAMPPDYTLRPPQPGAPRPQDALEAGQLRETVLGTASPADPLSPGENFLLQQTGGVQANPDIRAVVDQETSKLAPKTKTVSERLIGFGKPQEPQASVVDPVKEAERLKENKEAGKPVTDGETPAVIQ